MDDFKELREALAMIRDNEPHTLIHVDTVRALLAALDDAEARARDMERERDQLREWEDLHLSMLERSSAHLGKRPSESNDEAAERVARERDAAQARVRELEALLGQASMPLASAVTHLDEKAALAVLHLMSEIDAALADGADREET